MMIVGWNQQLAQKFPNADHRQCVQRREELRGFGLVPTDPPQCLDYHCSECGKRSSVLGAHDCQPPQCNSGYGFSSYCSLRAGHTGKHTNGAVEWDDQAAEAARRQWIKKMEKQQ